MAKPRCLCTGRVDIRCDGEHCDLAGPPGSDRDRCVICWQYLHSGPHRQLWDGNGPALPAPIPPTQPTAPLTARRQPPAQLVQLPGQIVRQPPAPVQQNVLRLGDRAEALLQRVGITKERVSAWMGKPCGCPERKAKMNELSDWVENAAKESVDRAKSWLERLLGK